MALFSTNLNSLSNFAVYDTDIKFLKEKKLLLLILALLLTLKSKSDKTAQKNEKGII
jgi:hypothetical protein